tara:strand:- start:356 stop:583 length:228 start_codon:yes stop_codon:yes gene_type:complete
MKVIRRLKQKILIVMKQRDAVIEEETVKEETVEVVEKEYYGVTYYLEIETNDLYNNEMELVGLWNAKNNKPLLLW